MDNTKTKFEENKQSTTTLKRLELPNSDSNEKFLSSQKKYFDNVKFFLRSDGLSSSFTDAFWTPYYEGDCRYLEEKYQDYGKKNYPEEVYLSHHKVNFKQWIQINLKENWRKRPIKRDFYYK